jgi:phosphatidate cytidylyltransferase
MLKTRVITAAIYVPVLLALIFFGGWPLTIGLAFLTAVGLWEYGKMLEAKGLYVSYPVMMAAGIMLMLFVGNRSWTFLALAVMLILILLVLWAVVVKRSDFSGIMLQFGGIIYIGLGFGFVLLLRLPASSWWILLLAFLITWATDVGAYFFGRALGKRKLAPTISPNKTVAGAVGGVICAIIIAIIYGLLFLDLPLYALLLLAAAGSVAGQLGDLWASMIKRWADIKDAGKLFPGHGGVLDRFDSVLFVAPLVYLLLALLP